MIQLTERSGCPAAEFTVAEKERAAPSSTGMACGETDTETSLVIVTEADPVLELSAVLVASTLTTAGTGKSAGAVYTPLELIVPTHTFPPGIPFTLQSTARFEASVTTAVNGCESPSKTGTEEGVTVTVMTGAGGDGFELARPPQPNRDAARNKHEPLRRTIGRIPDGLRKIDPPCMPRRFARNVPARSTRGFVLVGGAVE
jgi:hypothetical protein